MINLKNISFKYDNSKEIILNKLSLFIDSGEVIAIVGPSGGGKSTLLRIIAGLENPFDGEIIINGRTIFNKAINIKPEKRDVGMVFQDYALFPHMTVKKNIEYGISHLSKAERKTRVLEVLDLVELQSYSKRYPHELSGGQQQRIALARALAPRPKLLLLDEPFSNLDAHLLEKLREDLFKILRKTSITTIMVTHNLEDARTQADRVVRIEATS